MDFEAGGHAFHPFRRQSPITSFQPVDLLGGGADLVRESLQCKTLTATEFFDSILHSGDITTSFSK
jgi:hypothetical protein